MQTQSHQSHTSVTIKFVLFLLTLPSRSLTQGVMNLHEAKLPPRVLEQPPPIKDLGAHRQRDSSKATWVASGREGTVTQGPAQLHRTCCDCHLPSEAAACTVKYPPTTQPCSEAKQADHLHLSIQTRAAPGRSCSKEMRGRD